MATKQEQKDQVKLTAKQERFCYEYCIDFNATRAAAAAGYSKKTAFTIGCENLKKPYIKTRIEEMQKNLAETAGLSALRILKEHQKIAFSDAGQLRSGWITLKEFESLTPDQKACIQEVSTKVIKQNVGTREEPIIADVEYIKIKMYDKQKSLDSINRMLGYDAPVKVEANVNVNPFSELMKRVAERKNDNPETDS
ncbi:MAG: terminase small subunit [Prolixibacteraceae bacterium]